MKLWQVDVGEQRHWVAATFKEEAMGIAIGVELQGVSLQEIAEYGVEAGEVTMHAVTGLKYSDQNGGQIDLWEAFKLAGGVPCVVASHPI